jgi:hypothetical protein
MVVTSQGGKPRSREVLRISLQTSPLDVEVKVSVSSLSGARLADGVASGEFVNFDVKARMEERERRSGLLDVGFAMVVGTRPSVVKFEVKGRATAEGKEEDIKKMLEPDPDTQIPLVFRKVYQHVFVSMYLLATLIDVPYPPANLLHSSNQETPTVEIGRPASTHDANGQMEGVSEPSEAGVEGQITANQGQTATSQPTSSPERIGPPGEVISPSE